VDASTPLARQETIWRVRFAIPTETKQRKSIEDFNEEGGDKWCWCDECTDRYYHHGRGAVQQDQTKSMELYAMAAELGSSNAHYHLGIEYHQRGDSKKATFHYETAAMAGHELARCNLGNMEDDCRISWGLWCHA
jgi:hypothetical protein